MALGDKARRGKFPLIQRAAGKIENPVARTAVKMVVMLLLGSFIQSAQIRMVDRLDPPAFDQLFQIPVNSCLIEGFDKATARLKDFFDLERAVLFEKHFPDGIFLNGFSFHLSPSRQDSELR